MMVMDEVKRNILQLCEKEFLQYGIRSVSIDDLCRQLGISKKTFYVYFKQKEDLVDAFLLSREKALEMEIRAHMGTGNAIDDLLAFMRQAKILVEARQQYPALFYDLQKYYPLVLERHILLREIRLKKAFASNLQKGIDEGLYRSDMDIDMVGIFFSFHLTSNVYPKMKQSLKGKAISHRQLTEFYVDMLARYITTPQGWSYLSEHNTCKK